MFQKWDKAMEVWTKESGETSIDPKSIIQRVDSNGWVPLSPLEQHHYEMWRSWRWRLNGDD